MNGALAMKANRIASLDRETSGAPTQWKVSCRVNGRPVSFIKATFAEAVSAVNALRASGRVSETIYAEV